MWHYAERPCKGRSFFCRLTKTTQRFERSSQRRAGTDAPYLPSWWHIQDAPGWFAAALCSFAKGGRAVTLLPVVESKDTSMTFGPAHFINRELSWLEFNQRVLDEALDPANPLLERREVLLHRQLEPR